MICPYCNKEMNLGVIHGDRYALKWVPKENDKGIFTWPLNTGIKLNSNSTLNNVEAFHCNECSKIIIDVPK